MNIFQLVRWGALGGWGGGGRAVTCSASTAQEPRLHHTPDVRPPVPSPSPPCLGSHRYAADSKLVPKVAGYWKTAGAGHGGEQPGSREEAAGTAPLQAVLGLLRALRAADEAGRLLLDHSGPARVKFVVVNAGLHFQKARPCRSWGGKEVKPVLHEGGGCSSFSPNPQKLHARWPSLRSLCLHAGGARGTDDRLAASWSTPHQPTPLHPPDRERGARRHPGVRDAVASGADAFALPRRQSGGHLTVQLWAHRLQGQVCVQGGGSQASSGAWGPVRKEARSSRATFWGLSSPMPPRQAAYATIAPLAVNSHSPALVHAPGCWRCPSASGRPACRWTFGSAPDPSRNCSGTWGPSCSTPAGRVPGARSRSSLPGSTWTRLQPGGAAASA